MISKAEIKKIRTLNTKKGRDLHNLILIEGKRLIEQAIKSELNIEKVWITENFEKKNVNIRRLLGNTSIDSILEQDLNKISKTKNPSGIIGVMNTSLGDIKKSDRRIIILDGISDPGNLGTILRTANWFGIKNVILSEECVDQFNSKVVRAGMGSHFNMNIVRTDIVKYVTQLQSDNFKIIAAEIDTNNSIENLKLSDDKWALLMGNEAHGLSESILSLVDCKIKIPQLGKIESLNVSVACGIFLYHISRIK